MLSAEPVESMAKRTSQLKNAFSPEVRIQAGGGLLAARVLAKSIAECTQKHQDQSDLADNSPGHVALLAITLTEDGFPTRVAATTNLIYHRNCLTQIKLFRFIGFRFVLAHVITMQAAV
jgi:hypothetical protein